MNTTTAVVTILSIPGVVALVNLVKSAIDIGRWAAMLAFLLGIGVNLGAYYAGIAYVGEPVGMVVCVGALVGLGASGIFDVTKNPSVPDPIQVVPGPDA